MRVPLIIEKRHVYVIAISAAVFLYFLFFIGTVVRTGIVDQGLLQIISVISGLLFQLPILFILQYKALFKEIGYIDFDDDKILICKKDESKITFNLLENSKIRIISDRSKGNSIWKIYILKIQLEQNGKVWEELTILVKKRFVERFKSQLKSYYKKGLNIRESSMLGSKLFLLKENLSYNEIQNIKREYKIGW